VGLKKSSPKVRGRFFLFCFGHCLDAGSADLRFGAGDFFGLKVDVLSAQGFDIGMRARRAFGGTAPAKFTFF